MVNIVKACMLVLLCTFTVADIGVPETGDVRLVDGSGSYEGRVEIFYDSQWGTVCDDGWDIADAAVVCRQLGFISAIDAFPLAFFGEGSPTQPVYLNNIHCSGNETQLLECEHDGWGSDYCLHYQDAGVRCHKEYSEGDVRLLDGPASRHGRLEIYHNDQWGAVCNTTWGREEAEVTCRQLGNDGVNNVYYSPTPGDGPIHLSDMNCIGNETGLVNCDVTFSDDGNSSCTHSEDVGLDCYSFKPDPSALQGELRLTDRTSSPFGRLEIYHGNSWGSICEDGWVLANSEVACRQLGYSSAGPLYDSFAIPGFIGPVYLSEISCSGDEVALSDCPHSGWGENECRHTRDIWLQCTRNSNAEDGDIRLVDGETAWTGKLQIFYNQKWGTICNDSWSYENALVACRQLGFIGVASPYENFGPGYGPIQLGGLDCEGYENTLRDCSHNEWGVTSCTSHKQDVGLKCTELVEGDLRLVDGPSSDRGTLEIFYDNVWGTICNDGWSTNEALVACRQLGFPGVASANSYYGFGEGPIHLDDVSCTGYETRLVDCSNSGWGAHDCQHYEDVGIQCSNNETLPEPGDPVGMPGWLIAITVIASMTLSLVVGFVVYVGLMKTASGPTAASQLHISGETMPSGYINAETSGVDGVMYRNPHGIPQTFGTSPPPTYCDSNADLPATSKHSLDIGESVGAAQCTKEA